MRCPSLALPASLLALVLLAGCSADAEPAAEPPGSTPTTSAEPSASGSSAATPDASPSASPSASAASGSPVPVPTRAPAGESAEAFIRRWLALEFQMGVTGGTEAFLRVSRGCVSCERTAAAIRGFYRRGGYVRGGRGEIERLKRLPSKEGYVVLLADLSYEPTVYRKSSGSSESRLRGGPTTRKLTLDREDGEWNMFEFTNYRTRLP